MKDTLLQSVHTGYQVFNSHIKHTIRLGQEDQGGLVGDLNRCKTFINGLENNHARFVRPVEGVHSEAVRDKYTDAGLKMIMWHVDSGDALTNDNEKIHENLRTGIETKLQQGLERLVILFHELDANTRGQGNLAGYISTINQTIENFVLDEEADEEEEDQTQFVPNWDLTTSEIRDLLNDTDWVGGDDPH